MRPVAMVVSTVCLTSPHVVQMDCVEIFTFLMEVLCLRLGISEVVTIETEEWIVFSSIVALGAQHKVSSSVESEQQPVRISMTSSTSEFLVRVLVSTEL
jgi:hypothetical protein